jgi:hypothetical protein
MLNLLNSIFSFHSNISEESLVTVGSSLFDGVDSIYNVEPLSNNHNKSYIVDKIFITPQELSYIKLDNLSEFMRKDILQ